MESKSLIMTIQCTDPNTRYNASIRWLSGSNCGDLCNGYLSSIGSVQRQLTTDCVVIHKPFHVSGLFHWPQPPVRTRWQTS
jgi:hypothetical protein